MAPRITDKADVASEKPLVVSVIGTGHGPNDNDDDNSIVNNNNSSSGEGEEDGADQTTPLLGSSWSDDEILSSSSVAPQDWVRLKLSEFWREARK